MITLRFDISKQNLVLPSNVSREDIGAVDPYTKALFRSCFEQRNFPPPEDSVLGMLWLNHVENYYNSSRSSWSYNYVKLMEKFMELAYVPSEFDPAETESSDAPETISP